MTGPGLGLGFMLYLESALEVGLESGLGLVVGSGTT